MLFYTAAFSCLFPGYKKTGNGARLRSAFQNFNLFIHFAQQDGQVFCLESG